MSERFFAVAWVILCLTSVGQTPVTSRVVCDGPVDRPAFLTAVKGAVNRALPGCERALAATLPEAERIILHFHATRDAWTAAVGTPSKDAHLFAGAATLPDTNESHLLILPTVNAAYLAKTDGLPEATLVNALRETTRQVSRRSGLFPEAYLPDWYAVGRAEFLASRAFQELKKRESTVHAAMRLGHLARQGDASELAIDALLERGLLAREGAADAARESIYCFFEFLATTKDAAIAPAFAEFEAALRARAKPAAEAVADDEKAAVTALFKTKFGDYGALKKAFRLALKPSPVWAARSGGVDLLNQEILCASAESDPSALAVAPIPAKGKKYAISGEVRLSFGGDREANVLIAYDPLTRNELTISIAADGTVNLRGYRNGSSLGFGMKKMPGLPIMDDGAIPFDIQVNGRRVNAKIRDLNFTAEIPADFPLPAKAYWGGGARKSIVAFKNLKLRDG